MGRFNIQHSLVPKRSLELHQCRDIRDRSQRSPTIEPDSDHVRDRQAGQRDPARPARRPLQCPLAVRARPVWRRVAVPVHRQGVRAEHLPWRHASPQPAYRPTHRARRPGHLTPAAARRAASTPRWRPSSEARSRWACTRSAGTRCHCSGPGSVAQAARSRPRRSKALTCHHRASASAKARALTRRPAAPSPRMLAATAPPDPPTRRATWARGLCCHAMPFTRSPEGS